MADIYSVIYITCGILTYHPRGEGCIDTLQFESQFIILV